MQLKGLDELNRRIPELNSTGGKVKFALRFLAVAAIVTTYFILTDQIPTWTLDSQIVIVAIGFLFISRFFTQKKILLEKYGDEAYRHAIWCYAVPGLAMLISAVAHIGYMNGPAFTQPTLTTIFSVLGWFCLAIGIPLWIRSALAFGFDNLSMLYVYFPQEGLIVRSSIYNVLRHPVYAGILRVGFGLAFLNMGIYAITFSFLMPLGFFGWVRLVEEKELLERIPNYAEYRKHVPAFWPRLSNLGVFFKFLLTGG
ncbi:MAG: hypothetical protein HZB18_10290 [Chloroflexi bacterium]|nr:hypothetical protein [Chloroflexota bacterium]